MSPLNPLVPICTEPMITKLLYEPTPQSKRKTTFSPPPVTTLSSPTVKQIVKTTQQSKTTFSSKPNSQKNCNECGQCFKETSILATHMEKHLKQKLTRDLESGRTNSKKKTKCVCDGCLFQPCGECQTCRNKHFKKRCLFRKCII